VADNNTDEDALENDLLCTEEDESTPTSDAPGNDQSTSKTTEKSKVDESTANAPQKTSSSTSTTEMMVPMSEMQNMFQTFLQNMISQSMTIPKANALVVNLTEQQQWEKWDKEYPTPNFVIRQWPDHEKLSGPKNFKQWKNALMLDLRALNLVPFEESEKAITVSLSPSRRSMLDAQALQVIHATVAKNLQGRLQKSQSAFSALKFLTDMFDGLEAHYLVKLHNRFTNLRFRPGYDPIRFISDFDDYLEEYALHGNTFSPKYVTTLFLQKIDGIYDSASPYYTLYNMICQNEDQSFQNVKEKFLAVDNSKFKGKFSKKFLNHVENKKCIVPKIFDRTMSNNLDYTNFDMFPSNCLGSGNECVNNHENNKNRSDYKHSNLVSVCSIGTKRKAENKENIPAKTFKKPTNEPGSSNLVKKLKDKYTSEQLSRLKTMSKEEKAKARCAKCGEYFHKAAECKNPGRLCFECFQYGHEKKDCTNKKGKFHDLVKNEKFDKNISFLVDSGASHHVVGEKNMLIEYSPFKEKVEVTTAAKQKTLLSFGEGSLPMLLTFGKKKSVVVLQMVQYIPEITEPILSVRKFNKQFRSSLILNANSGYLFSRYLRRKIALVSIHSNLYYIHVSIVSQIQDISTKN